MTEKAKLPKKPEKTDFFLVPPGLRKAVPGCLIPFMLSPILAILFLPRMRGPLQPTGPSPAGQPAYWGFVAVAAAGWLWTLWVFFGPQKIEAPLSLRVMLALLYAFWLFSLVRFLF